MGKLVIFYLLISLTQNEIISNNVSSDTDDVAKQEYLSTFNETFEDTADYWKAESKALEAEDIAENRTNLEDWLAENKNNIDEIQFKNQC